MREMAFSELKKLTGEQLKELMPLRVMFNQEPIAMLVTPADVVVIAGMHPRVQIQFRGKEKYIRAAMHEKPEKVKASEA